MKTLPFSIIFLFAYIVNSQVGIATTTPRATLEISNTDNGGLLIPKYALTGNNDIITVVNPQPASSLIPGTIIYNTNTITGANAIDIGIVYWDGSLWQRLSTQKTPKYGEIYNASNYNNITNATALTLNTNGVSHGVTLNNNSIVALSTGVYRVTYTVSLEQISGSGSEEVIFYLTRNNAEVPGTRVYIDVSQNPDFATVTRTTYVNVTTANQSFAIKPNQSNTNVRVLSGTSLSIELVD